MEMSEGVIVGESFIGFEEMLVVCFRVWFDRVGWFCWSYGLRYGDLEGMYLYLLCYVVGLFVFWFLKFIYFLLIVLNNEFE